MVTRVVEVIAKPGKGGELCEAIEAALPLVKECPGFVDKITLVPKSEPRVVLVLRFWRSLEDAEQYERELFPAINELLRPFLEVGPTVRVFDLRVSAKQLLTTPVRRKVHSRNRKSAVSVASR